jgi:hypothetical protein
MRRPGPGLAAAIGNRAAARLLQRRTGDCVAPAIVHDVLRTAGEPLDPAIRQSLEPRIGAALASVRVHHDPRAAESARAVSAQAYAVGEHVVFGTGRYAPATPAGRRLLAHELAHVVQQRTPHPARGVQRFTMREHTEIGNLAYAAVTREFRGVGPRSPLRGVLERGSRFRWGDRVKVYGDLVADADYFDTFSDFFRERGRRAAGLAGLIDEGRLATRNLPHFTPHNVRAWVRAHDVAVEQMLFAHRQLAWVHDRLHAIDPLLEGARRAILAGDDARADRLLSAYRARFEPIRVKAEKIIPAARRLAWESLLRNAFAEHYLTDAFAAGHIVTPRGEILREAGVAPSGPVPGRAEAVRAAVFTTWAELHELRAQARSLAWHDLDNYYGVEVAATDPGFAPWIACGDRCSERAGDPHWHATRAMALRATKASIADLWRAGLTGVRPPDYRAVLDLLPRPTWRGYPRWDSRDWRNQLKFIRGESVPHAPGTQLPGVVATVLWPIEHCPDLDAGCSLPYVGTSRDWVERWSMGAWVRPLIGRVKATAATRYDFAAMGRP